MEPSQQIFFDHFHPNHFPASSGSGPVPTHQISVLLLFYSGIELLLEKLWILGYYT
jgi:hypothetical protein